MTKVLKSVIWYLRKSMIKFNKDIFVFWSETVTVHHSRSVCYIHIWYLKANAFFLLQPLDGKTVSPESEQTGKNHHIGAWAGSRMSAMIPIRCLRLPLEIGTKDMNNGNSSFYFHSMENLNWKLPENALLS